MRRKNNAGGNVRRPARRTRAGESERQKGRKDRTALPTWRSVMRSVSRIGPEAWRSYNRRPSGNGRKKLTEVYDTPCNIIENYLEDNIIVSGLRNQILIVHIPNMLPESFRQSDQSTEFYVHGTPLPPMAPPIWDRMTDDTLYPFAMGAVVLITRSMLYPWKYTADQSCG